MGRSPGRKLLARDVWQQSLPMKLILHCSPTDSKQMLYPTKFSFKTPSISYDQHGLQETFSEKLLSTTKPSEIHTHTPSRPRRIEPYVEIDPNTEIQYRRTCLPAEILTPKKISSTPLEVGNIGVLRMEDLRVWLTLKALEKIVLENDVPDEFQ